MSRNYALISYPLSHTFKKSLEAKVQEPIEYILLTELRTKPLYEIWKYLRACKSNTFFLPIEDYNAKVLLPILQILAKVAMPKQIIVVYPDFQFQKIKLLNIANACLRLFNTTLLINLFYQLSRHRLKQLQGKVSRRYEISSSNKRVLYLNTNLWFGVKAGGSVGHIAGVANAFVKKGLNVDYAAVEKSAILSPAINYICLPDLEGFGIPAILNYHYFNKKVHKYLIAQNKRWDFIYQRMSIANFSGVTLARQLNIPLILEYNGSEVWVAKNWAGRREHASAIKAEEICLSHADVIVTISEVLKEELITRGVKPERVVCYPNCIDPTIFNPTLFSKDDCLDLRKKYHIAADEILITFIGTFGQWHGVNILAQVIKLFIDENPTWLQSHKVKFLLVGDGIKMSEVKQILGSAIDSKHVILTGLIPQQEAPGYLAASDILLSPHVANADGSRFFGSPTKLFEYMAMGKAIIASDLDQIGEVIQPKLSAAQLPTYRPTAANEEMGILCEPGNVQSLQKAIQFLVENAQWREILGTNAREEALAKYTWEKHVDAFLCKFSSKKGNNFEWMKTNETSFNKTGQGSC